MYVRNYSPFGFIVAVAALLLASCWVDPYPEYRGVNLLEDRGLGAASFGKAYFAGVVPAFDYINYDGTIGTAEYGAVTGLPAGADTTIHRLELYNLLPNGDFEVPLTADWSLNGGATFVIIPPAGNFATDHIQFDISVTASATFDLTSLDDGFAIPGTYHVNLVFEREFQDTEIIFDYGDGASTSYLDLSGLSWLSLERQTSELVESFPDRDVESLNVNNVFTSSDNGGLTHLFYVGTPKVAGVQPAVGYLDDVRIGRVDILPHVVLAVPPAAGVQLPFVPGIYTFSIYVKSEIDTQVTPTTPNAFRAAQISLGVNDAFVRISQAEGGWNSSRWTKVSRTFTLDAQDIASDPVVALQITVSDSAEPAVGRILVADPSVVLGSP